MILVDSDIPMYLVGSPHPHKADAQRLLEGCVMRGERLVTDAEVLQEILHCYVAINRLDAIQPAFDVLLGVVDDTFVALGTPLRGWNRTVTMFPERVTLIGCSGCQEALPITTRWK